MAVDSSANIGIRVFLDNAASGGLGNINQNLRQMSGLTRASSQGFGALSSSMAQLAVVGGFAASFIVFAGAIGLSVTNAIKFQTLLIQMQRAGNLTTIQMLALGQSLMQIGGNSIFSLEDLSAAFVTLLQRGVSARDMLAGVSQAAVYLAEATGQTAVQGAQQLASAMVAFNIPASKASETADLLQFAIEHGIGPSDTLTGALSKLGSIASVLHLTLSDVIPAFDIITRATGSYTVASTALYYYLNQVKFGTASYRDEIQKLGISFYDSRGNFIGLNQSLVLLYNTLKNKSPQEAAQILGSLFNIRSSQGISILMQQMSTLAGLTNNLAASHNNLGMAMARAKQAEDSAAGAWQGFQTNIRDTLTLVGGSFLASLQPIILSLRNMSIALRQFATDSPTVIPTFLAVGAAISGIGLAIGLLLLPLGQFLLIVMVVATVVGGVSAGIAALVLAVQSGNVPARILAAALGTLAFILTTFTLGLLLQALPTLIGLFAAWTVSTWVQVAAMWGLAAANIAAFWPVYLIAAAIILIIAGVVLAIMHWSAVMTFLKGVVSAVGIFIMGVIHGTGAVFSWLGSLVHTIFGGIASFIGAAVSAIGGKFSGLGGVVHGAMSAVGSFVHAGVTGVGASFSWLGSITRSVFNAILGFIGGVFSAIGATIHNAVVTVVGWFSWLYNHNYYFANLVNTIRIAFALIPVVFHIVISTVEAFVSLVGSKFSWLGSYIHNSLAMTLAIVSLVWHTIASVVTGVVNTVTSFVGAKFSWLGSYIHNSLAMTLALFSMIWSAIQVLVMGKVNATTSFVGAKFSWLGGVIHGILVMLMGIFSSVWSAIQVVVMGKVNQVVSGVGSAFSNLGGAVRGALTGLWNWIVGFLSGWPAQMMQFGINLILGLINGIGQMLGNLKNIVGNVAGTIASILGFHSDPKEGPASRASTWMPNMMRMLASTTESSIPSLKTSMGHVAGAIKETVLPSSAQGGSGSGGSQFIITLDGKVLYDSNMTRMRNALQAQGMSRLLR